MAEDTQNTDTAASAAEPSASAAESAENKNLAAPEGGQIALTAHNNQDGTWSITLGPDGHVLEDGLARDEALAIVGAPTGPYEPATEQEARVAERRRALEDKAGEIVRAEAFEPDEEGAPKTAAGANRIAAASRGTPSARNTENARRGNGSGGKTR